MVLLIVVPDGEFESGGIFVGWTTLFLSTICRGFRENTVDKKGVVHPTVEVVTSG
jgi:hypothetical protein